MVIGAGSSFEAPTSIPLASAISLEAHRRLVLDGVLADGDCVDPRDLSALASVVFAKTGRQLALVREFPRDRMRVARPNEGHKVLVALMSEGAISHTLSLNFDLAVQNAATELGLTLTVVDRVNDLIPAANCVVHLHGSVSSSPEDWILRADVIDAAWKQRWQQVIAQQILAVPSVLFVGLGSAAPVLTETVRMIGGAVGGSSALFQADVSEHEKNGFAQQLEIQPERYMRTGWCGIMSALAQRVADEHRHLLKTKGIALLTENGEDETTLAMWAGMVERLSALSLLGLGRFRANLEAEPTAKYLPRSDQRDEWMVAPLIALARAARAHDLGMAPIGSGFWAIQKDGKVIARILLVTGKGTRKLAAVESSVQNLSRDICELSGVPIDFVIVGGATPSEVLLENVSVPLDIVEEPAADDIVANLPPAKLVDISNPAALANLKEWLGDAA